MSIAAMLELEPLDEKEREKTSGHKSPRFLALIGSGGKTTLLWHLAQALRHKQVLVSTSARMLWPAQNQYDTLVRDGELPKKASTGISFAARQAAKAKAAPLSPQDLAALAPLYDVTLVEADGSRGLPFKGWADYEPVVPDAVDTSLVIIPARPGLVASEEYVHRLPIFCAISGAKTGQEILPGHIAALIAHPLGTLLKAKGRIALFFNQAENGAALDFARQCLALLPPLCRARLWKTLAGSARDQWAQVI